MSDLGHLIKQLEALDKRFTPKVIIPAIQTALEEVVTPNVQKELSRIRQYGTPINYKSKLFRSLRSRRTATSGGVVSVEYGTLGMAYGASIEKGSRPHKAPYSAIQKWVATKATSVERWQDVWFKISQLGTEPEPYLQPGFNRSQTAFTDRLLYHLRYKFGTF